CCHNALSKAGMEAKDLDAILLVGGSTYGHWVRQVVEDTFPDVNVQINSPDLCIAAGAAIVGGPMDFEEQQTLVRMEINVPEVVTSPSTRMGGRKTTTDCSRHGISIQRAIEVILKDDKSTIAGRCQIDNEGRFTFPEIRLIDDHPTTFNIVARIANNQ